MRHPVYHNFITNVQNYLLKMSEKGSNKEDAASEYGNSDKKTENSDKPTKNWWFLVFYANRMQIKKQLQLDFVVTA